MIIEYRFRRTLRALNCLRFSRIHRNHNIGFAVCNGVCLLAKFCPLVRVEVLNQIMNNKPSPNIIALRWMFLSFCALLCSDAIAELNPSKLAKQRWFSVTTPHFIIVSDRKQKAVEKMAKGVPTNRLERVISTVKNLGFYQN